MRETITSGRVQNKLAWPFEQARFKNIRMHIFQGLMDQQQREQMVHIMMTSHELIKQTKRRTWHNHKPKAKHHRHCKSEIKHKILENTQQIRQHL